MKALVVFADHRAGANNVVYSNVEYVNLAAGSGADGAGLQVARVRCEPAVGLKLREYIRTSGALIADLDTRVEQFGKNQSVTVIGFEPVVMLDDVKLGVNVITWRKDEPRLPIAEPSAAAVRGVGTSGVARQPAAAGSR